MMQALQHAAALHGVISCTEKTVMQVSESADPASNGRVRGLCLAAGGVAESV